MVKLKEKDILAIRKAIEIAVMATVMESLGRPVTPMIRSAQITHTALEPLGDKFTLAIVVEAYPKEEKNVPADTPAD